MTRRKFTPKFKTKVVLEALKERHSLAELAQKYEIHPQRDRKGEGQTSKGHRPVEGRERVFKGHLALRPLSKRRKMIRKGHSNISIARQCRTLSLRRLGLYYRPRGESELNLKLMR